jgi:AraC family transcriptional regulator of arabinose operon
MYNKYLFQYEVETTIPAVGVLLADHFHCTYGYYGHRSQGTNDWLMIYTKAGEGSFRVEKEIVLCKQGETVILPPGVPHHYAANEGANWEIYWTHFIPLPQWNQYLNLPQTEEKLIKMSIPEGEMQQRVEHAFDKLIGDSRRSGRNNHELAMLSLAEILILVYVTATEQKNEYHLDERIEQALQYVADHIQEKHDLSTLARLAGLSLSRFRHLFKEQTGKKVTEWITAFRLQKAARLLDLTAKPVNEIATDVGFESSYYFTRRFTERFGISPSAYRKQLHQRSAITSG